MSQVACLFENQSVLMYYQNYIYVLICILKVRVTIYSTCTAMIKIQ